MKNDSIIDLLCLLSIIVFMALISFAIYTFIPTPFIMGLVEGFSAVSIPVLFAAGIINAR